MWSETDREGEKVKWATWAPGGLWWDVEPWCSWHTGRPPSSHPGSPPPGSRAGPRPSGPAPAALVSEPPRDSQATPRSPSTAAVGSHHAPGGTDGKTVIFKLLSFWCILCLYATNVPVWMWNREARYTFLLKSQCEISILEIAYFFSIFDMIYFLKWAVEDHVISIHKHQASYANVQKLPLGYLILSVIFTEIRCGNPVVI